MEFIFHQKGDVKIAELTDKTMCIENVEDAVDLLGNADYQGARRVIVQQQQLHPDFFVLRTGMAGEILQKFSNYRMQLAIVGDFKNVESKSLRDFIRESNRQGRIFFVSSIDKALDALSG
mgnify:CR=1 FL=1